MSINLNKNIAPISDKSWEVINSRAKEVISSVLSARKALPIKNIGEKKGINTGRISVNEKSGIKYGVYQINPLVETRINFTLNRWELDNIERGVLDVDLSSLEKAVLEAAKFEEEAIYNGLPEIKGLLDSSIHEPIPLGNTALGILSSISTGITLLKNSYAPGVLDFIVDYDTWIKINSSSEFPIGKRVKDLIKGEVILSKFISSPILIPHKNENFEICVSQDFAIGYQGHTDKEVTLFITEDFTYRTLDEALVVIFKK